MLTLTDPIATLATSDRTDDSARLDAGVCAVLALRFVQLAEVLDEFPLAELATFHIAEPGDTLDSLAAQTGLPIVRGWRDDAPYGTPAFAPAWDILERHDTEAGSLFEMVFVLSDSGYAVILLVPDRADIDETLRQMCQTYATPAMAPAEPDGLAQALAQPKPQFPVPQDHDVAEAVADLTPALREAFEERAAILEYDAGLLRRTSQRQALAEVPVRSRRLPDGPEKPEP